MRKNAWLCKHGGLRSEPQKLRRKSGVAAHTCNSSGQRQEEAWEFSVHQSSQNDELSDQQENLSQGKMVKSDGKRHPISSTGLHTRKH